MKPIIIEKDFDQLLTEVQEAFANREKGPMGIVHKQGSGEKAIAEYFKTLGIEIDVKNEFLVEIASQQKQVTPDGLKNLLLNVNALTQDQERARQEEERTIQQEMENLIKINETSGNTKKTPEEKTASAIKKATTLIIAAYNECVGEKGMTADNFAIKLFGDTFKRTPEMKKLAEQSQEVFKALHSQYGNYKIEDNLAKVENNLTTWEKIKDFISKILSFVVDMGTNAGDKEKYKANKMEPKSLLKHAAKNPSGQQIT
jgi:hypothetical protein